MPKKVSEKEKEKIIAGFLKGETIDVLSKNFNCSKITISRHLKNNISEIKYKDLIKKNKNKNKNKKNEFDLDHSTKSISINNPNSLISDESLKIENQISDSSFIEIPPLNCEIDNLPQKDLSSTPIADIDFPNIVYMIVDKNIELETKYLKEYPEWQFLSQEELNRRTIEIYLDLNVAKRLCNKEQRVIKVPNTNVFKIVVPILLRKGISRIVNADKLIAL